jgi:alcohol dehydrogenase (NADP+)
MSQGGFASHTRVDENWVFPIPDGIDSVSASAMLCGGITAFSPLVSYGDIKGKKVGVVGLGGIGHFAVLFAKALGAEVWVISRSRTKEPDALKLGADGFIATSEPNWNEPYKLDFDLILNTANSTANFDLSKYLSLLDVRCHFISVGLPSEGSFNLNTFSLIGNGVLIGASHLGNREQTLRMLQLAADKHIQPWIEQVDISEDGLLNAMFRMEDNKARYRICMTGFDKVFERSEEN